MIYSFEVLSRPYPKQIFVVGESLMLEWEVGDTPDGDAEAALRKISGCSANRIFTTLDQVERLLKEWPHLAEPALFLFHLSRCGSTLACNFFATDQSNRVFCEPGVLGHYLSTVWRTDSDEALRQFGILVRAHGFGANAGTKRLIIKMASMFTPSVSAFKQAFPDVPAIFLFRDPVEVMERNVARPAGFLERLANASFAPPVFYEKFFGISREDLAKTPLAELCEIDMRRSFETALDPANYFEQQVNYSDLGNELRLIDHVILGSSMDEVRRAEVAKVMNEHSKNRGHAYVPNSEHEASELEPKLKNRVRENLLPLYNKTLKKGKRLN